MSNLKSKLNSAKSICIYGSNNPLIPQAKPAIASLFTVVAEQYMVIPEQYLADVIRFLTSNDYVFRMKNFGDYAVVALQYQKPPKNT